MKNLIILLLLLGGSITAMAQTPIVNSKIKYKDFKDVKWINGGDIHDEQTTLVEFYIDGNPSCRVIMDEVLLPMHKDKPDVQIIILAFEESTRLRVIAENYPGVNIGLDPKGSVFKLFGVKYVPQSVLIGENDRIKWRGALNQSFSTL